MGKERCGTAYWFNPMWKVEDILRPKLCQAQSSSRPLLCRPIVASQVNFLPWCTMVCVEGNYEIRETRPSRRSVRQQADPVTEVGCLLCVCDCSSLSLSRLFSQSVKMTPRSILLEPRKHETGAIPTDIMARFMSIHHAPARHLAMALPFLSPTLTAAPAHPKIIQGQVEVSAMCHVNLRVRGRVVLDFSESLTTLQRHAQVA